MNPELETTQTLYTAEERLALMHKDMADLKSQLIQKDKNIANLDKCLSWAIEGAEGEIRTLDETCQKFEQGLQFLTGYILSTIEAEGDLRDGTIRQLSNEQLTKYGDNKWKLAISHTPKDGLTLTLNNLEQTQTDDKQEQTASAAPNGPIGEGQPETGNSETEPTLAS